MNHAKCDRQAIFRLKPSRTLAQLIEKKVYLFKTLHDGANLQAIFGAIKVQSSA